MNISKTLFYLEVYNCLGVLSRMQLEDEFKCKNQDSNSETLLGNSGARSKKDL